MSAREAGIADLLSELTRLTPQARMPLVRSAGAADELCIAMAEQLERLAITDLPAAIAAGEALRQVADESGSPIAAARARRGFAQALAYANRYEDSLAALREAISIAEDADQRIEAARVRLAMVHALARLGRYDEAIAAGEAARAVFLDAGEEHLLARAAANLGVTHRMRDDPAAALAYFDEARQRLADHPMQRAQVQSNRAEALLDLNRFTDAEEAFRDALARFRELSVHRAAAIVEGNLADLCARQGRFETALEHFERAAQLFEDSAAPGDLARLRAEHAEALAAIGAWGESIALYEQALPVLGEAGLAWEAARAAAGLGRALARLGRLPDADRTLADAAGRFSALGHATGAARVGLLRGELAELEHRPREAKIHFTDALAKLSQRPADAAMAHLHLARLALKSNHLAAAEASIAQAQPALERLNLAPGLAQLLHTRALLRRAQQRPEQAIDDLRGAVGQIERLRGMLQGERLRAAFLGTRLSAYEDLILALLEQQTFETDREALSIAERARSRTLLDMVAGALAASGAPLHDDHAASLLDQVSTLRIELNALYARLGDLSPHEADREVVSDTALRDEIEKREGRLGVLESRLAVVDRVKDAGAGRGTGAVPSRRKPGPSGPGSLFTEPVDADGLLSAVPSDAALIEYYFAGDELLAFVAMGGEVNVARNLASRLQIAECIAEFSFQLTRSLSRMASGMDTAQTRIRADFEHELERLHRLLLAPLRLHVPEISDAQRLIIVPHGALHGVPFHALRDRDADGRYAIEQHAFTIVPSASLLAQLARGHAGTDARTHGGTEGTDHSVPVARTPRHSARLGSLGSLVVGVEDPTLPAVEEEVHAVAAALGNAELLVGPDATVERVLRAARGRSLVHLACHGRFSAHRPLASGLRLADRWLTVRELCEMRLEGAIVTLSACESGRSAIEAGDELAGLVRGFFAAGASSLVLSLWPVSDKKTAEVMASTYRTLQNKEETIAACLRSVQRRMVAADVHPALWAPFTVTGV